MLRTVALIAGVWFAWTVLLFASWSWLMVRAAKGVTGDGAGDVGFIFEHPSWIPDWSLPMLAATILFALYLPVIVWTVYRINRTRRSGP